MDPAGARKASVVSFVDIILMMKLCVHVLRSGSVSPFRPRGGVVLYPDRPRSPGRLQPSLVC